ncbi:protein FRIGIDA [Brassica rapa]|uniref:FRIGIDA-like protein n=2 Tax=Brassica campestris TaxID=3711 RepID=F5B4G9_BRACM|nr:protein FRIGIDA [Brassica rapa]AEB33725.1 FRIGIDA [Brassica rapa]AEJ81950.1 FRIGIDA-like protein [Brassica rapa subsp. pekinensis]
MAVRNGSLLPAPSTREEEQPSSAMIQRREAQATVETVPTNIETTIEQSNDPQFLKSIVDLTALAAAVDAFKRRYDELQSHMDYIGNAIDSNLKTNGIIETAAASPPPQNKTATAIACQSPPKEKSEAERFCESMWSKELRRYMFVNISERAKLIEEIPGALKLAKDPAKFVLDCIGKFYLQGRKAFAKDLPAITARKVSLLILECYLLTFDPEGEKKKKLLVSSVKDEAEAAAVAWKKRLVGEGWLGAAEAMDARGLLLLVACFGIPESFKSMDLLDLIRQSGTDEIVGALKRSPFLVPMMSGIVDSSIKRGMHIEALELVYTFGMEDRFSPSSILTSFLRMRKDSFERAKRQAQAPMASKTANEKQLDALSSVMKCLEAHKLDPAKEVPGWQIKEQMAKLEKDIVQLDKQMEEARSISRMEEARSISRMEEARSISIREEAAISERLYNQQMKRPRLSEMEMPPTAAASYSPMYRDHRSFPSHREGDADEISALVSSYLGPSSGFPHRSGLMRSPEYMVPPGGLGRSVYAYDHLPPNSYSPVHGQRRPQEYPPPVHGQHQMPYRLYRHSPSVERHLALSNHRTPRNLSQDRIGGM